MHPNGDLILFSGFGRRGVWESGTSGHPGADLVIQDDGTLVIYDRNAVIWNTGIVGPRRPVPDPGPSKGDRLGPNQQLLSGEQLVSANRQFRMQLQSDGNFVVYDGNDAIWATGTGNREVTQCIMQTDGNLVIYNGTDVVWAAGTDNHPGAYLVLQDDGNAVMHADVAIWAQHLR
jgi:hypothetical protein